MKKFFILFIIGNFYFVLLLKSQFYKRIENIELLVWNTYKHEIINDSITKNKFTVNQKTYDSNNSLIVERIFDENTHNQIYYINYFYDSLKRIKSIEKYSINDNKPLELEKIIYNNKGDTNKIIYFCSINGKIMPCKEKIFEYKNNKLYSRKVVDLNLNKTICFEKITYLKNEIPYKISGIIYYPTKQKYELIYDINDNNILNKTIFKKNSEKIITFYNLKNKPIKIEYYNNNVLNKIKLFNYEGEIELKNISEYDRNNKLQKYYSLEYYYHKITNLNLKSYFDNNFLE